ncbi:hypothetical protein PoB_007683100 [Plakobranchus ocellatus]|uniref:Uncharacterized protein n=1 Tax=Plakobranchus ocellatus TaxID=259542 RepID=A0AAV4E2N5_9GAST|nr:hypothetical protein PoB_007683100 [Plakobranchus ocellatus]
MLVPYWARPNSQPPTRIRVSHLLSSGAHEKNILQVNINLQPAKTEMFSSSSTHRQFQTRQRAHRREKWEKWKRGEGERLTQDEARVKAKIKNNSTTNKINRKKSDCRTYKPWFDLECQLLASQLPLERRLN